MRKVMGGGWGIFQPHDSLMFPFYDLFRLVQEYFLGFLDVRDLFLHKIFPCIKILLSFARSPPPPPTHTISNGPSLMIDT